MKNKLPTILGMIFPYLFIIISIIIVVVEKGITADALTYITWIFFIGWIFDTMMSTSSSIYLMAIKESSDKILFNSMLIKLVHIPFFIIVFLFGCILLSLILTIPLVILIAMMCYLVILPSSIYSILGIIRAFQEKKINIAVLIIGILFQFIFVGDVISTVIIYFLSSNKKKNIHE